MHGVQGFVSDWKFSNCQEMGSAALGGLLEPRHYICIFGTTSATQPCMCLYNALHNTARVR